MRLSPFGVGRRSHRGVASHRPPAAPKLSWSHPALLEAAIALLIAVLAAVTVAGLVLAYR